eukprot:jgi/Bigna1/83815/fgenesh1_pg.116_\
MQLNRQATGRGRSRPDRLDAAGAKQARHEIASSDWGRLEITQGRRPSRQRHKSVQFLPRMYIAVGGLGLLLSSALFGGVFVTRRKERTLRSRNFTNSTNSIGGDSSWAGWRHDVKH